MTRARARYTRTVLYWGATISLSFSRIPALMIGTAPRSPECVSMVLRWCGGQKRGGEVAYAGNVTE